MHQKRIYKYFLLASLYFTQLLPMAFFFSGLPMIMRAGGYSLASIGYLGFMGIPYALKFLWAPYIDRGAGNPNHYKRVVFIMTCCYSAVAIVASQINPTDNLFVLIGVLCVALTFLATQDIAVDAIATRILTPEERGMGNGLQAAGGFCGYLSAGIMLLFYDQIGWQNAVLILSLLLLLSLIPLIFFHEPAGPIKSRASFKDIFTFFRQREILPFILIAVCSGIPLEAAYHKMKPLLVDAEFNIRTISFYISIVGMISGLLVSLLFGYIMKKTGIKKGFVIAVIFALAAFPALLLTAYGNLGPAYILAAVILGGGATGGVSATLYALYMTNARPGKEGTDFTVQNALAFTVVRMLGPLYGYFADEHGYTGLFIAAACSQLLVIAGASYVYSKDRKPAANHA